MSIIIERTPLNAMTSEEVIEGTLQAINLERQRRGLKPQPNLLGGYYGSYRVCPVGRTLGLGPRAARDLAADEYIVNKFVARFDAGYLDQLREEW